MQPFLANLQSILDAAVAQSGVPGASVAIARGGTLFAAASGQANAIAAIDATPETVYLIGSVTKPLAATLVMQLIERGLLSLDDTLQRHLPELVLSQPEKAREISIHSLLCHTSGIDGDRLIDSGQGADYLEKFVAACAGTALIHEPGAFFSYCNTGYILLGRIVEKLTGQGWDAALKELLLEPLGLKCSGTLLEDLVMRRFAPGHIKKEHGGYDLAPRWVRSNSPSGARLYMTPSELVAFARMHMTGGESASGRRILGAASVARMQGRAVEIPLSSRYQAWGLGWMLFDWGGQRVFGHDGGVAGTTTFLRVLPEHELIVAVMTNGENYSVIYDQIIAGAVHELAGIASLPELPPAAERPSVALADYAGKYVRSGLTMELTVENGRLMALPGGEYGDSKPVAFEIHCIDRDRFRGRYPGVDRDIGLYFLDFDASGRPGYLHCLERAFRRTAQ